MPRSDSSPKTNFSARQSKATETRAQIVQAALEEFTERGFAGARLEDIAKRAGVAKGTIYIHFKDKEALFEGIITTLMLPYMEAMDERAKTSPPRSPEDFWENYLLPFVRSVEADRRVDILRLQIAEGPRFPALSEIYYRVIIEPNITRLGALVATRAKPEVKELADFPQLIVAPIVMGLLWNSLFGRFKALDVEAMARLHFRMLSVWLEEPQG